MSRPSREEIVAVFHTDTPMKAYAASIGMSPNTLRRIWKEAHGEEAYRTRGKTLQAKAASEVAKRTASARNYKDVLVSCSSCDTKVKLSTRQTSQMKDLGSFQCKDCQGLDRECPVCGQKVNGKRGLSSHFRHRRDDGEAAHIAYELQVEEARWLGKVRGRDYVQCLECGHRALTLARHLKAEHGITAKQYRGKHGKDALVRCVSLKERRSEALTLRHEQVGSGKGETKTVPCSRCQYPHEVSKFASEDVFVCGVCQHKEEEAKWAALSEPEDYVSCRVPGCGYRAESLMSHIQNTHPELIGRYLEAYPTGHICSLGCDLRVAHNSLDLTREDLSPFFDKKGRVQVSLAADSFGVAGITIRRYCKLLNLPTRNRLALQKEVLDRVAEVLQEDYIWEWSHPKIVNPETGYRLYFDGFFEKSKLVVAVHGEQHFKFIPYWHKTEDRFEDYQRRDRIKRAGVLNLGLRHLVIRWDEEFRLPGYLRGRLMSLPWPLPERERRRLSTVWEVEDQESDRVREILFSES